MRGLAPGRYWSRTVQPNGRAGAESRWVLPASEAGSYGVRWGSGLALAVLCLLLAARVASVLAVGAAGQVPFTVALFTIPLLCTIPRSRAWLSRRWWLALAVQATLTWAGFGVFGGRWQVGIGGVLAGLVLLAVPGWASWLLAGGLLAAEVALRALVTGLPISPAWFAIFYVITYYADSVLVFFGLVRLAQIVGEVAGARDAVSGMAVAGQRLEAATALQAAVGERLAGIAASAAAARHAVRSDPVRARAQIAAAGAAARDAVAQAREVAARHRDLPSLEPDRTSAREAVIGARLAWAVLVMVLSAFAAEGIASVINSHDGARLTALAVTDIVLATALQLYHSGAVRNGRRPWAWPVTLAVQALLAYAFLLPFVRVYAGASGPLLAGSILLLIPGRWRWAGFVAAVASYSVLFATLPQNSAGLQLVPNILYLAAITAEIGLLVYGLAWLAGLAAQLQGLNAELARVAMVRERLRIARDVHDLLGLGLSAIALKTDLIGRLIGRDDARALSEIEEMGRICASARAEIHLVTGENQRLSLAAELVAARQILEAAGITVRVDAPAGPLPELADDVLAPVLREAVTNILRHSHAAACTIEIGTGGAALRLQVANDGVRSDAAVNGRVGDGLANLATRLESVGGCLTSRQADGTFALLAEIPDAPPSG